ncbi:hypothetical protein PAESOLCIP111_05985 [Paenibacillus solanacearum]|uniref:Endonuclease/exonuclease/phosphatase domain-containing protein n=1 Tax=Paenibacillus solanacearum TaxID=2048548 RepID=A0A916NSK6_9BACL|nr:endonuclease/exonuclease/phosphatase family protein [Paenibacillus solanacearum]CAG7649975.1 hypothetical protein PAESOLCIP111_05985 [Paenibacillus solanacearum]
MMGKRNIWRIGGVAAVVMLLCAGIGFWRSGEASLPVDAPPHVPVKVMTFNLRYLNTKDEQTWSKRLPVIAELLRREMPDVIGTQEGVLAQLSGLDRELSSYGRIGEGREGKDKGEYAAIFYNKTRLALLESGNYWLSDQPEKAGSKSWGNRLPRMATWAKFEDVITKRSFYLVNTHLDHESEQARIRGVQLIHEKSKAYDSKLPVILTGDFNSTALHAPYRYLSNEGQFQDVTKTAKTMIGEKLGTYHGYRDPKGGGVLNRIDWILYRGQVTVNYAKIDDFVKDGIYPSDHYPLIAELLL